MTDDLRPESTAPETDAAPEVEAPETEEIHQTEIENPAENEAASEEESEDATEIPSEDGSDEEDNAEELAEETEAASEEESEDEADDQADNEEDEDEFNSKPRPPAKMERLQKILAQAGVASRRSAEEMIELGTKADANRDHIRVDGKLLQGAERLRYFVLNKPKGFVTTVKDPEGRPTVMQFFEKMRERLYPVGRLDYMSEGLLLVTNDGELANRLTRASAGVEKTYLVKVAGQPTEAELDILRHGVSIERGKPGSPHVRTSPARIRQVRQGDNPWYEVVLIEGRNRELRKMFEEVGHFVEKIRRIGYGPLVLDQEPGNLRELQPEELEALRKVAEGKLRTPKSKEVRRRDAMDAAQLPTVAPKPSPHRPPQAQPFDDRPASSAPGEFRPKRSFGTGRPSRPSGEGFRPTADRSNDRPSAGPAKFGSFRPAGKPAWKKDFRPSTGRTYGDRPASGRSYGDRPATGRTYGSKPAAGRSYGSKPAGSRSYGDRPSTGRSYGERPAGRSYEGKPAGGRTYGAKPAWNKSGASDRPAYKPPVAPSREAEDIEDQGPKKHFRLEIEPIPQSEQSGSSWTGAAKSGRSGRPASARPFRSEGGLPRPFTTSSGKPRAGGARPSSKPGRSYGAGSARGSAPRTGSDSRPSYGAKRSYGSKPTGGYRRSDAGSSAGPARPPFRRNEGEGSFAPRSPRPYTPRQEGATGDRPSSRGPYPNSASRADRKTGGGWKPKPHYGAPGKPAFRGGSKPGGFSKSGYQGKPSGSRHGSSSPRPGGNHSGGAPGGHRH
jgi:23S rRNA pseudouridine2605 synthase